MKTRQWACIVAACAVLAGCAAPVHLQRAQIGSLDRTSSPSDVDRILGDATVVAQAEVSAEQRTFLARQFRLLTGSRSEMTMVCTPTCIPIFLNVPVTSDYVVIQRLPSKDMHAWGTLEELSKDPDPGVSGIMPALKMRLMESLKK